MSFSIWPKDIVRQHVLIPVLGALTISFFAPVFILCLTGFLVAIGTCCCAALYFIVLYICALYVCWSLCIGSQTASTRYRHPELTIGQVCRWYTIDSPFETIGYVQDVSCVPNSTLYGYQVWIKADPAMVRSSFCHVAYKIFFLDEAREVVNVGNVLHRLRMIIRIQRAWRKRRYDRSYHVCRSVMEKSFRRFEEEDSVTSPERYEI